jgi:two-component system, sensor histidine kinase and response regulator
MTRVLVAEDDATLLEDITLELELRGYEVIPASDGQWALHMLTISDQLPDIIVSDIAMPDVDGFQLLEQLRSNPKWNGIPFLFLTAFDSPNSVRASKEMGADDYIVKPFKPDDLVLALENKLQRMAAFQQQAERKLDVARQTLLNMMSHELRTPLTTIYGGAEMLADSLVDTSDVTVQHMLGLIQRGAQRMNNLTIKAMALLQIDSGQLQKTYAHSRRPHDMGEIVQAVIQTLEDEKLVNERQVAIKVDRHTETLCVEGVIEYLHLMVEEPLRNAVTFAPVGGAVEITLQADVDWVIVTIQDQGAGIAVADLPRVWERFTQLDRDNQEQQGAGLGLAIVRESARIHGGDCTIASEPGLGTQVTLALPLAECI